MSKVLQTILIAALFSLLLTCACESDGQAGLQIGAPISSQPKGFTTTNTAVDTTSEIVKVRITNSDDSIFTVKLRKQGSQYIGPRGEHYNILPTPAQLKPTYGF